MRSRTVILPEEISIFNIEEFWKNLINKVESVDRSDPSPILLDFIQLNHIDGAGIQVLLSLEKTMLKEKYNVKYLNVSAEIKEIFKQIGLGYLLVMEVEGDE